MTSTNISREAISLFRFPPGDLSTNLVHEQCSKSMNSVKKISRLLTEIPCNKPHYGNEYDDSNISALSRK